MKQNPITPETYRNIHRNTYVKPKKEKKLIVNTYQRLLK